MAGGGKRAKRRAVVAVAMSAFSRRSIVLERSEIIAPPHRISQQMGSLGGMGDEPTGFEIRSGRWLRRLSIAADGLFAALGALSPISACRRGFGRSRCL
jgi:hypothetical protein